MRNKWTKEKAIEESKKYKSLQELATNNQYLSIFIKKHNLLNLCPWLKTRTILNYDECYKRALKYKTQHDFYQYDRNAHYKAQTNNWFKDYTWLKLTLGIPSNKLWTKEHIIECASQCTSKEDFKRKFPGGHHAARKLGLLNELGLPNQIKNTSCYAVYIYKFESTHSIYVGLTNNKNRRYEEHHGKGKYSNDPMKSAVYKHSILNNTPIPEPIYLYEKLYAKEAQIKEDEVREKYSNEGWNILNIAKTGEGSGALGQLGTKYTFEDCKEKAQLCLTLRQYRKQYYPYYDCALRNKWHNAFNFLPKFKYKKNTKSSMQINQYTLDGEYIRTLPSMAEAERLGYACAVGISLCCRGKQKQSGGYIWKYAETDTIKH